MRDSTIASVNLKYFTLKRNLKLLDFGFGDGSKSVAFATKGLNVTATDIDKSNIEKLNKRIRSKEIKNIKTIKILENKKLPFNKNHFDRIIANEVLEHIKDFDKALRELYRVTAPSGVICISVPTYISEKVNNRLNNKYFLRAGHVHIFKEEELLSSIEQAGFKVNHVDHNNFQFAMYWALQSFFKVNPTGNGTVENKPALDKSYWKIWGILHLLKLGNPLIQVGNKIFPKSIYVYASK